MPWLVYKWGTHALTCKEKPMILTLDVPKALQRKLERDKKRTGLSKSYIVRQILMRHYAQTKQTVLRSA